MFFYEIQDGELFCSLNPNEGFAPIEDSLEWEGATFFLQHLPNSAKRRYPITESGQLFQGRESLEGMLLPLEEREIPGFLQRKMEKGLLCGLNTARPLHRERRGYVAPEKWRVTLVGLGDVGANLMIGLRLLGRGKISSIGIYAPEENACKRLEMEVNQIYEAFSEEEFPRVEVIPKERLMDTDLFAFVASKGVPPVGSKGVDVRMVQYQGNCEILGEYAKMARDANYCGIFAVVSDPVDQLCQFAYTASNTEEGGCFDGRGLGGEQIRGFGLGVMNARALYFSKELSGAASYGEKGRAYGPHGEGLIIANDIENYDEEVSKALTQKTITANLAVRELGYKPYIAPAFSSGALSLLAVMNGHWHYSSTCIDGAFLGVKNRETCGGILVERVPLPTALLREIQSTHQALKAFGK